MRKGFFAGACCSVALVAQTHGQQVEIARDARPQLVAPPALSTIEDVEEEIAAERLPTAVHYNQPGTPKMTVEQMRKAGTLAREKIDKETRVQAARIVEAAKLEAKRSEPSQPINLQNETAFTKVANGFDFPVGKPDAQGYYKARGFRSHGHLGEDWDGIRGGDTDLGDPICSIGDGVVVFARDCHMGWGNVVIIRHAFREDGTMKNIDSLYGHLNSILVQRGQAVSRGQKIATMGTAHGLYDAHLHLEIRKNLTIGMSRAAFAQDDSNYYDPSQFILSHRHLKADTRTYRIAMNTFSHDAKIRWDKARNFSHAQTGGGSGESAAALNKAIASQH